MSETVYVATDPLGAIRVELVKAARRQTAIRQRRKRVTTTIATALMTLVSVGGASAVIGGTTGVPEIDRFLELRSQQESTAVGTATWARDIPDIRVGSGSTSKPLDIPSTAESSNAQMVAYASRSGHICLAFSKPHGEGVSGARGGADCFMPASLSQRLAGDTALITGMDAAPGEPLLLEGYARADVEEIAVFGPGGRLRVELGDVWDPPISDIASLRAFVAVSPDAASGSAALISPKDYFITALLADGRTVEAGP